MTIETADLPHFGAGKSEQITCRLSGSSVSLQSQQSNAKGPQEFRVRGNDDRTARTVSKGMANGRIERDAPLYEYLVSNGPWALHPIEKIPGDRVHKPGHNVITRVPLLLCNTDVRIDEGGASRLELNRGFGGKCDGCDFAD